MASVEELRSYAGRCLELARRADDPGDRARLLEMAEAWQALADKVSARDAAARGAAAKNVNGTDG